MMIAIPNPPRRRGTHKYRHRGGSMRKGKKKFSIKRMLGLNPGMIGRQGKKVVEVLPLIAGVIANNLATGSITKVVKTPLLQKGIGNYVLGLLDAGLLGWAGTSLVNKQFGASVRIGGMVEVLGRAIHAIMSEGFVEAFKPGGLGDFDGMGVPGYWSRSPFHGTIPPLPLEQGVWSQSGFQGINDFVSPPQINNAFPAQQNFMQYAMPASNAVAAPMHPAYAQHGGAMQPQQSYKPGMPGMSAIDMHQEQTVADAVSREAMMMGG